ncbi:MAG: hypothetical protein E7222_01325 [Clostridiales bacterium]|uniref:hypothetical protein n=1 Tax=Aminipila sp. TaxID=2060095 RepID=UPI001D63BF6E|nr:hypothetical protein [Aminipila sp.]MBE6033321.1 hypothetical protein [Clostridiales bacterium]
MRRVRGLQNVCIPINQANLIFDSRIIWRDLTIWIRSYINAKHGGLGDQEAIRKKLDELIIRSTNIFSLVFGEELGNEYVNFLTDFINYLDVLIDAQNRGDTDTVKEYTERLQVLPMMTATFLAQINPYWTEDEWIELLSLYNQMSIDQSTALLNKEDKEEIYIFDRLLNLSSRIGDYYSQGILDYLMYSSRTMVK